MDEKNEKLQPQQEALSPDTAAQQPQEAPAEAAVTEKNQAPAPEAAKPEASKADAPKVDAPKVDAPKAEPSREVKKLVPQAPKGSAGPVVPIAKPPAKQTPKANDATMAFTPIREAPPMPVEAPTRHNDGSFFDGSTWSYLGWWLLGALITVATLGIGLAWAQCMFWRYRAKHTVVGGRRMTFDGTGLQLFENYLVWGTLTVVTLGIFGLWVPFKVRCWYCSHLYLTGSRRRPSQRKAPTWRKVLVTLAAVLCFILLLISIILISTDAVRMPWEPKPTVPAQSGPALSSPPESTPIESTPPALTDSPTQPPTQPPESTPEPTTTPPETTPPPTNPPVRTFVTTAHGGLNVRATPNGNGKVLVVIPYGTAVTELDRSGNWVKVKYNGYTGWCSRDWLREI